MLSRKVVYSAIWALGAVIFTLPYITFLLVHGSREIMIMSKEGIMQQILAEGIRLFVVVFFSCLVGYIWSKELGFAGVGSFKDLRQNWQLILSTGVLIGLMVYLCGDRVFIKVAPGYYPSDLRFAIFVPLYAVLVEEIFARFGLVTFFAKVFGNKHVAILLSSLVFAAGHVNLFRVAGVIYRLNYLTMSSFLLNLVISIFFGYVYWRKGLATTMGIHLIANLRYIFIAFWL